MRAWSIAFAAFVFGCLAVVGCAVTSTSEGNSSAEAVSDGTGLPCAVTDVLKRNCQSCHAAQPIYGAPMPLITWDDLQATAKFAPTKKVIEQVSKRVHATSRPMPPMGHMPAADLAVLDAWIAAGSQKSTESCSAPTTPDAGSPSTLGCEPDQILTPTSAWTAAADVTDEYVCYGIDITNAQKRHAIAITPRIDNKTVLHHMDLFQANESYGPDPRACSPFANGSWRMMFAWAPGGKDMVLPAEAGFPLEGTTHYVVQIHYSNPSHLAAQHDGSGFAVCTTDQLRANDADVMAFGSEKFTMPPHANYTLDCNASTPATTDLHVFGMMPHLHNYGTSLTASLQPAGGAAPTELAKQSHWDINNQAWFGVDAVMKPGDSITTQCTWTNTADHEVSFGDSAADEMCYAFTMYYPRITASDWKWASPAQNATCTTPTY